MWQPAMGKYACPALAVLHVDKALTQKNAAEDVCRRLIRILAIYQIL